MDDLKSPSREFDPTNPNIARMYDYLLGGKDNFAADRALGDQIIAAMPSVQIGVQAQRAVLGRVVRYLVRRPGRPATRAGARTVPDLGTGQGDVQRP